MATSKNWRTYCQVRNGSLVLYDRPDEGFEMPSWRKPPSRKGYSGEVTEGTRKRIAMAIDIFLQISPPRFIHNPVTQRRQKFQLSFITLTISRAEEVPASEGHKALKVFLQHFKKPWSKRRMSEQMRTYIWKAEVQKRGQLHYHITTNVFLHLVEIRRVWNDIQRSRGWLDEYHKAYGKWDANSTDVHSVYKLKDVGRYLQKYIAKQEFRPSAAAAEAGFPCLLEPVRLDAKVWGCSEDLKGAKRFTAELDELTWDTICDAYGAGAIKYKEMERCRFLQTKDADNLLSYSLNNSYQSWKNSLVSSRTSQPAQPAQPNASQQLQ